MTRYILNANLVYILKKITTNLSAKVGKDWEIYASDKKVLRQTRYLPKDFEFNTLIQIYENKISIMSSEEENYAFIIESKELFSIMKQIHNILWEFSVD